MAKKLHERYIMRLIHENGMELYHFGMKITR